MVRLPGLQESKKDKLYRRSHFSNMSKHVFGHNSSSKASQKVIVPPNNGSGAEPGVKRSGLGHLITH